MVNRTLREAVFTGDRFDVLNTAIVITDGQSNVFPEQTIPEAERLQRVADVYVIGVTGEIDIIELLVGRRDFRP